MEVNRPDAECSELFVPLVVAKHRLLAGMRSPVDFDRKANLSAVEVDDPATEPMLPAEFEGESPLGRTGDASRRAWDWREAIFRAHASRGAVDAA